MDEYNSTYPTETTETTGITETVDSVSGVEPAKKRRKGPIIAGISAGVVALGAGGCVAAYNLSDSFKNTVKLSFNSPEDYYSWVAEKNTTEMASSASKAYKTSLDSMTKGEKASFSIKYEISDDVKQMAIDSLGSDVDDSTKKLIENFDSAKIGVNAETLENVFMGSIFADYNDSRLTTYDIALDMAELDVFARIPELTDKWIGVSIPEDELTDLMDDEDMKAFENILKEPSDIISDEELETLITRYSAVWTECAKDVELKKDEEVEVAGVDAKYTVLSVEFDEDLIEEFNVKLLETLRDDDIIKGIVCDKFEILTESEYKDELKDAIKEAKDNDYSDSEFTFKTYVDGEGVIVGFCIEKDDENKIVYLTASEDKETGFTFYMIEDDKEVFNIEASFEEDDKKYSGDIDITADGVTVTIKVKDYEVVNEEKGFVNGKITLDIPKVDPITLDFESDGDSQIIGSQIKIDGVDYGRVSLEYSFDENASPKLPSKNDVMMVDSEDPSSFDFSEYVDQADVEKFFTDMLTRLGYSDAEAADMAKNTAALIYEPSSGGFGFDDDDYDYDFDYDDDDYDDDDYDYDYSFDDPYEDSAVAVEKGQAYLYVFDSEYNSCYNGEDDCDLAYDAVNVDVKKDGTYTVKVTTDTEGYRYWNGKFLPDGVALLAVGFTGVNKIEDADVTIKSVDFTLKDGSKAKFDKFGDMDSFAYDGEAVFYIYEDDYDSSVDLSGVGEWKDVSITFEVSGLK